MDVYDGVIGMVHANVGTSVWITKSRKIWYTSWQDTEQDTQYILKQKHSILPPDDRPPVQVRFVIRKRMPCSLVTPKEVDNGQKQLSLPRLN
jgi:hypothetical protein